MEIDIAGYLVCNGGVCSNVGNVTGYVLDWTPAYSVLTVVAYDTSGNESDDSVGIFWGGYDCLCDFDGDGVVSGTDAIVFKSEFFRQDCN